MTDSPTYDPAREAAQRAQDKPQDAAGQRAFDQEKAAVENVNEGYEKAPPGAGGEPSWPTGGNISRGPKRQP